MPHSSSGSAVMAEHINRMNKITVLNIIREAKEISRAEIVKKSGLSAPTVTRIVDSLINREGLVIQVGVGESRGGRPPMIVSFNGDQNFVIGIDWGRTHIHGILANLNGETVFNLDEPVSSDGDFESDTDKVKSLIMVLLNQAGVDPARILGIGLAVAGFVNKESGVVEFSPNFGWRNVDVRQKLQESFQIPVMMDNVSRVMSLAELWYGLGTTYRDFVFINIGYGIGAGIISDGKPYVGFDGFAGEIGHVKVSSNSYRDSGLGPESSHQCACGKYDCLECYASGRGIAQTVKDSIEKYPDSLIVSLCEGNKELITTAVIAQAARLGDALALKVMKVAAEVLATAFANIANTLNPEAIIIGGKVALSGDYFLAQIQETFIRESLPGVKRDVKLMKSELIGEAAVKGAVSLILKEVLELNVTT